MDMPEMPEELKDLLEKLAEKGGSEMAGMGIFKIPRFGNQNPDYKTWTQVGTLPGELKMLFKTNGKKADKYHAEGDILKAKYERLLAEVKHDSATMWAKIYAALSLNPEKGYHITADGRVLMRPEREND